MKDQLTYEMAEAFLRWPLPESVCADRCATQQGPGRVGTNLLSFIEARQMMNDVVAPRLQDAEYRAQWYPVAEMLPPVGKHVLFAWVRSKGSDHTMRTGFAMASGKLRPSGNDTWKTQPTHWRELPVLNVR